MALLPEPRLQQVDDQTGLTVFRYDKMAPGRVFCDVVVVKASFELTPDGIQPIPGPGQLCLADMHRQPDGPLGSSLVQAGDLILGKPGADIYVTGTARNARAWKRWHVEVTLGPQERAVAQYACAAIGPRHWQHSLMGGWHLSEPVATQAVPINYELSWGGRKPEAQKPEQDWDTHKANPSGSGYSFAAYSKADTPPGPQWEAADGIFSPRRINDLTGLGPVARFWSSRQRYAGTYDEAWQRQFDEEVIPDYPADFDLRYFQCAHPALQTAAPLRGDEPLRLQGLLGERDDVHMRLPGLAVLAAFGSNKTQLPLDTVHIDLDAGQIHLVWHLTLPHILGVAHVGLELERR
jgi:hypothetical protein